MSTPIAAARSLLFVPGNRSGRFEKAVRCGALQAIAPAPGEQELQWARRVIAADAAANGAVVQVDGRNVELPVMLQARHVLARAAVAAAVAVPGVSSS